MRLGWNGVRVRCGLSRALILSSGLLGCSGADEPEFTYGKADMEGAIVGTWTGAWVSEGAAPSELTLVLASAPRDSFGAQCNSRVFSAGSPSGLHSACAASSALRLAGSLSVADGSLVESSLTGELSIWSLNLGPGELSLSNADHSVTLDASQDDGGGFASCTASAFGGRVTCTLEAQLR